VQREDLYQARFAENFSADFVQALVAGDIDGVALFSPRTATAFVDLAQKANLEAFDKVAAFCLSPAVADKITGLPWQDVVVAKSPDQDALLKSIRSFIELR